MPEVDWIDVEIFLDDYMWRIRRKDHFALRCNRYTRAVRNLHFRDAT